MTDNGHIPNLHLVPPQPSRRRVAADGIARGGAWGLLLGLPFIYTATWYRFIWHNEKVWTLIFAATMFVTLLIATYIIDNTGRGSP